MRAVGPLPYISGQFTERDRSPSAGWEASPGVSVHTHKNELNRDVMCDAISPERRLYLACHPIYLMRGPDVYLSRLVTELA